MTKHKIIFLQFLGNFLENIRHPKKNCILSVSSNKAFDEIVLVGNEEAVQKYAKTHSYEFIDIKNSKKGKPSITEAFKKLAKKYPNDILFFSNTDIILSGDFRKVVNTSINNFDIHGSNSPKN